MAKSTTSPSTRKRTSSKKNDPGGDVTAEAPKPNGGATPPDIGPTEDDIRLRAYHRYLERGGGHGADFEDWVEAEKDLKSPRQN